ncbi:LytR/AlgR family response regulator transcription factor [Gaoshiqia sediminis]|uniref:LytTR family DNA-binding domain-containing protein n=1 Tax=Gaoshiqia sediminis TaxID=2986998 RepID=A0AA41YAX1_9BACT|nr:LytTR family DNA-binding domain-containing protein [Gaoshiqia sediminis]MCW0482560.1 LytTR family DNA-binding domain-containing protein [Gaoshiqia sediminis]
MIDRKITAIIIDDDKEALSLLEIYLQAFHEVEVIESITNPKKGIRLLKRTVPGIVFLDIDMPELDGLEVAQVIKDHGLGTEIVFTTAHVQYAYHALGVEPLGYLVKPFGPEELISVINRYHAKKQRKELERRMELFMQSNKAIPKVKLATRTGIIFVNPEDIMLMHTEAAYCRIFLKDGREELIMMNIYKVVDLIDYSNIVRANRSAFINLQYLRKIEKKSKICTLQYRNLTFEEPISRAGIAFFEKLNCFPIT